MTAARAAAGTHREPRRPSSSLQLGANLAFGPSASNGARKGAPDGILVAMRLPLPRSARRSVAVLLLVGAVGGGLAVGGMSWFGVGTRSTRSVLPVQHVVVIVKENHTFDNYFGRYPG